MSIAFVVCQVLFPSQVRSADAVARESHYHSECDQRDEKERRQCRSGEKCDCEQCGAGDDFVPRRVRESSMPASAAAKGSSDDGQLRPNEPVSASVAVGVGEHRTACGKPHSEMVTNPPRGDAENPLEGTPDDEFKEGTHRQVGQAYLRCGDRLDPTPRLILGDVPGGRRVQVFDRDRRRFEHPSMGARSPVRGGCAAPRLRHCRAFGET